MCDDEGEGCFLLLGCCGMVWFGLVWYSDWGEGFVSSCTGLCVDMGCWEGDSRVHLNLAISTGIV